MNIQRATPANELLAKLIFLIIPTAIIGYFLLEHANQYFSILQNNAWRQAMYFAVGMSAGAIFYAFRFRFLPSFALLCLLFYTAYKGLDNYASSEFDAFFISVQFLVFAILFSTGWLLGWGFVRLRYFSSIVAGGLLVCCILLIAKANTTSVAGLLKAFVPALFYAFYIIFTSEQIYSYKDKSKKFWWYLTRRLGLYTILTSLLFIGVYFLLRADIKETIANYGGGGKQGENSMLKKNKDGSFDLKDYSKLTGNLGRNNELLFCAHIDNFFPGTDIPNPLYLTAFYYTKFDTLTETFERDSTIPYNDLFEPDPSRLPMFFTKTDSSVIKNSLGDKMRIIVDAEIYSKNLSPNTYLAPSTGFFVQPISIEKDFRNEFKTAFRTKSYVSLLNSAYFIYNAQDAEIRKFQEQRFEVLRKVTGYEKENKNFMAYYTYMPQDEKFNNIATLAKKVTATAKTPVDKVLAIRDYFLSKDENGEALYKYTDNPGVPDIPSASKLMYFLFDNHKGYCAYYAGATLFMLRALGIPSRITVGFLTMDRSGGKNKGWYWYYADQAHAWVQVYFPGYGWLDFDTTVGNDDARESPKPDGTPPMQPPRAWLAADGTVAQIDTLQKLLKLQVKHFIFHDKEYNLDHPTTVVMDMKIAAIRRDSMEIPLKDITIGEMATAVSYAEAFKKLEIRSNENAPALIARFPTPAPIDEVYLKAKPEEKTIQKPKTEKPTTPLSVEKLIAISLTILATLLFLFALLPSFIYHYYYLRFSNAKPIAKPYWTYKATTFYLHQLGYARGQQTPLQYASSTIDPLFGTSFTTFIHIYLRQKYASLPLSAQDLTQANSSFKPFITKVKAHIKPSIRIISFLNPMRSIGYFVAPNEDDN